MKRLKGWTGKAFWLRFEKMRHVLGSVDLASNVAERKHWAWRPLPQQIKSAVVEEFSVEPSQLLAKQWGERYGEASQAAISKAVQRVEARRDEQHAWERRLSRLEHSLRP